MATIPVTEVPSFSAALDLTAVQFTSALNSHIYEGTGKEIIIVEGLALWADETLTVVAVAGEDSGRATNRTLSPGAIGGFMVAGPFKQRAYQIGPHVNVTTAGTDTTRLGIRILRLSNG